MAYDLAQARRREGEINVKPVRSKLHEPLNSGPALLRKDVIFP
jgi:hypothetical protein